MNLIKSSIFFFLLIYFSNISSAQYSNIEKSMSLQLVTLCKIFPSNKPAPKIIIDTTSNTPAYFNNSIHSPTIYLNINTYLLSKKFNSDSIAFITFILTHELYHYYHNDYNDVNYSCWATLLNNADKQDIHKIEEANADYYAAQYAYVVGYNIFNQIPIFIDEIYKYFNLPDIINGYPSKNERKNSILKSELDYINFCHIYTLSKLLYITKDFDGCIQANLELENKNINNISTYNNIAVCYLQKSFMHYTQKEEPNLYPIEFDSKNRFDYIDHRTLLNNQLNDSIINYRNELLNQSKSYLYKALAIDNENKTVLLNLAIINNLQGKYNAVIDFYQSNSASIESNMVYYNYLYKISDTNQIKKLKLIFNLNPSIIKSNSTTFHAQNIITNINEGLDYPLQNIEKMLSIGFGKYYSNDIFVEYNTPSYIIRFKKEKLVSTLPNQKNISITDLVEYYGTANDFYIIPMSDQTYIVYPNYGSILYTKENKIYMILYKKMKK